MGILNSSKNGLYAFIQPVIAPDGSVQVASALAPQQLLISQNVAHLDGSPIETTASVHPLSLQSPDYPGAITGTKNGIAKAVSGYSKTFMIKGKPVVTNTAKKLINYGNCPISPMVAATQSKTYVYVADGGGSGNGGLKNAIPWDKTPEALAKNPQAIADGYPTQEDFDVFVATVYGEAAGQSGAAWRAVGSTIISRINNPVYVAHGQIPKNARQVIEWGGYDAYQDALYNEAYNFLTGKSKKKPPLIHSIKSALYPIYWAGQVTTDAVQYYSPKAQYAYHLKDPKGYSYPPKFATSGRFVAIPNDELCLLPSDDFQFFRLAK